MRQFTGDKTKGVLVHFYDPENEDCKKIEPKWNDLAVSLADKKSYVIGKFDSTENESKIIKIKKLPTIMFFPKGNKNGLTYLGDPVDTDAVLAWAQEMEKLHPLKNKASGVMNPSGLKMP